MSKLKFVFLIGLGIVASSFAQTKFNFQAIDLPSDASVLSVNNNGAIACGANNQLQIWTPQLGLTPVVILPYDKFRPTISDSGKVYGESNGSIVQFSVSSGHHTILSRSAYTYSIVDSSQDNLLIKSRRGSSVRYLTIKAGVVSAALPIPIGFVPTSIGADGTVRGLMNGGTDSYGFQGQVIARLSSNGTATKDPYATLQSGGYVGYTSYAYGQTIQSLSDGTVVVTAKNIFNGYHSSTTTVGVDIYYPGGSHVQVSANSSQPGDSATGTFLMLPLKDGRVLGSTVSSPLDFLGQSATSADHLSSVGGSTWVSVNDPSVLEASSIAPDRIVAGTLNGVLVGRKKVGGVWTYSISMPPSTPGSRYLRNRA